MSEPGIFTLSFDTELAWGSFDRGGLERYADDYRRTPAVVDRLCSLLDRHEIPATWALVGHLLEDCGGEHETVTATQREWLSDAPCTTGVDRSLWYAPDLLERIENSELIHDVGLHGYSHLPLSDVDRDTAEVEVEAARAVARSAGLDPASFVFPRNRIGHVDVLAAAGFEAYRGRDDRWYERRSIPSVARKPLRFVDEAAGFAPPVGVPAASDGVVAIPGSHPFRPDHGGWGWTPAGSRRRRARKGLERAAGTGGIYHLWLHPFNLAREPDAMLEALDDVFEQVAELRDAGRLDVATMAAVATEARDGRWRRAESNSLSSADPEGARRAP